MTTRLEQVTERVVELCCIISNADPGRERYSEWALRALGKALYEEGGVELMQEIAAAATVSAAAAGKKCLVSAVCNSKWHGIGRWER
jgi:hypothetical protein